MLSIRRGATSSLARHSRRSRCYNHQEVSSNSTATRFWRSAGDQPSLSSGALLSSWKSSLFYQRRTFATKSTIGTQSSAIWTCLSSFDDSDEDRSNSLPSFVHQQQLFPWSAPSVRRRQTVANYDARRRASSLSVCSSSSHELLMGPVYASLGLSRSKSYGPSSLVIRQPQIRFFSVEPPKNTHKTGSYSTSAKIPTPTSSSSAVDSSQFDMRALVQSAMELSWSVTKTVVMFLLRLPWNTFYFATHGKERRESIQGIKDAIRKEVDHYWSGAKLLMADIRTARRLVRRTLTGSTLTRRERKQLLRTVSDLFRLVPFSMLMLVPFFEFALPFVLKVFPKLLPSTFQDSLKAEESMKRELQSRIAMAQFFSDTLEELAVEQKRIAGDRDSEIATKQEETAASLLTFLDRARSGEMMPPDVIVQYANYFRDDLTLDNMPRMQLINMCKYMSIPPYGADSFLRFQLRHKIRVLKEDDQRILWEGIDSLTKMELREACQDRGMRSTGLSKEAYKRSLQQWLDLSVNKSVPISLLIMSRIFFLQEEIIAPKSGDESSVAGLADAISGLDKEVLNEVILEVATSEEKKSDPDVRKIKLEVLAHQNEMIREEQAERAAVEEKKKKATEKIEEHAVEQGQPEIVDTGDVRVSVDERSSPLKSKSQQDPVKTDDKVVEEVNEEAGETAEPAPVAEGKSESELSAEEMEALATLVMADPVCKEREELEKIKSSMQETHEEESEGDIVELHSGSQTVDLDVKDHTMFPGMDDKPSGAPSLATSDYDTPSEMKSLEISLDERIVEQTPDVIEMEEAEDPVVARLKKRLESMVDKIEVQLSDVEVKIGNKLHILDKDMDGILSREEMADCLQQVLKRNITFDEAMEIANEMDENKDGVFTVQELLSWVETNRLVKFQSEGRDADMDRIMEKTSEPSEIVPDDDGKAAERVEKTG